jgi:prolyl oligopeptidase PreP (S9A serine peptidase family)
MTTGYGGNSVSTAPWFSPSILTFLQRYGGVSAVVNIRGGGEFGEAWHLAAIREHKVCPSSPSRQVIIRFCRQTLWMTS